MSQAMEQIERLIELGRWAPSGDNTQPWRFARLTDKHFVIHGFDTRSHCVYDLDGHASQLSIGALIETLHIAASEQSLQLDVSRRRDAPETTPTFDVYLRRSAARPAADPLLAVIARRSVFRRPMRTRPLRPNEVAALSAAMPPGFRLRWFASGPDRWRMARLMFANAKLRLTMREAYEVHRTIIDWGQRFSADRVPDQALGADPGTLRLMRWVMGDWQRVQFINRWLAGTLAPRLQMDLGPALLCAAHVAIVRDVAPRSIDDYVESGRAMQRLWLTATALGLQHQPEMTPLIFSRYVRDGTPFSESASANILAKALAARTNALLGPDLPSVVWLGRLGEAPAAASRSLRLEPEALVKTKRS